MLAGMTAEATEIVNREYKTDDAEAYEAQVEDGKALKGADTNNYVSIVIEGTGARDGNEQDRAVLGALLAKPGLLAGFLGAELNADSGGPDVEAMSVLLTALGNNDHFKSGAMTVDEYLTFTLATMMAHFGALEDSHSTGSGEYNAVGVMATTGSGQGHEPSAGPEAH